MFESNYYRIEIIVILIVVYRNAWFESNYYRIEIFFSSASYSAIFWFESNYYRIEIDESHTQLINMGFESNYYRIEIRIKRDRGEVYFGLNRTIIGLKYHIFQSCFTSLFCLNRTIIGLKWDGYCCNICKKSVFESNYYRIEIGQKLLMHMPLLLFESNYYRIEIGILRLLCCPT